MMILPSVKSYFLSGQKDIVYSTLHIVAWHNLHPWGDELKSWKGKILSRPSSSTNDGFVYIREKQPNRPWCFKIVSMKNWFASLITLKSHLKQTTSVAITTFNHQSAPSNNYQLTLYKNKVVKKIYPRAWAALIAATIHGSIGVRFRHSLMSSAVWPREWSSFIIPSYNRQLIKINK